MTYAPSLVSLHASLLAAMGLAACGGNVVVDSGGSTGSASVGAGAGPSGSGSGAGGPGECAGAVAVPTTNGADSGFARCPDGTIHRVKPVACSVSEGIKPCAGTESQITCKTDGECTMSPHGRCASVMQQIMGGDTTACACAYPCAGDAECQSGQACVCSGVVPANQTWAACAPAACLTGAGCASGECGLSSYNDGCGLDVELGCRAPTDACRVDAQCTAMPNSRCVIAVQSAPKWVCSGPMCAIGRPLIVGGTLRTAAATDRDDWAAPDLAPDLAGLDAGAREALVGHWLEVAALEHASVASFARFTLELLALGAPAALVAEAQRAALDEVEHARLAYGLAGAYAGRALGPDALDLASLTIRSDAREVLGSLVIEGCVGETLGVAEALALADGARDPAIRAVQARIAADEQRHAELSWRALAWLLRGAGDELTRVAARGFEQAIAEAAIDPVLRRPAAPEHGVLGGGGLGVIRRRALREVVAPCAAALLEQARRQATAAIRGSSRCRSAGWG